MNAGLLKGKRALQSSNALGPVSSHQRVKSWWPFVAPWWTLSSLSRLSFSLFFLGHKMVHSPLMKWGKACSHIPWLGCFFFIFSFIISPFLFLICPNTGSHFSSRPATGHIIGKTWRCCCCCCELEWKKLYEMKCFQWWHIFWTQVKYIFRRAPRPGWTPGLSPLVGMLTDRMRGSWRRRGTPSEMIYGQSCRVARRHLAVVPRRYNRSFKSGSEESAQAHITLL